MVEDIFPIILLLGIVVFAAGLYFGTGKIIYLILKYTKSYTCEARLLDKSEKLGSFASSARTIPHYEYYNILLFLIDGDGKSFHVDKDLYEKAEKGMTYNLVIEANEIREMTALK